MNTRVVAGLLCALLPLAAHADEDATPKQLRGFPEGTLTITHSGGRDTLKVWIADTPERQQQGLMFVRTMPRDRGMLFPQREPRVMSMWMKNTYLSLDMIFIGPGGTVTGVTADTRPLSLDNITSPGPIVAVLELNAGEARRRGIAPGSKVESD